MTELGAFYILYLLAVMVVCITIQSIVDVIWPEKPNFVSVPFKTQLSSSPTLDASPRRISSGVVGHVTVIYGPMFSSKTTKAINRAARVGDVCQTRPLYIGSKKDSRSPDGISSHSPAFTLPNCFDIRITLLLAEVVVDEHKVIVVDEAQFFEDLLETVKKWKAAGKTVIVAGLKANSDQEPFGQVLQVLAISDEDVPTYAICRLCMEQRDPNATLTPDALTRAPHTRCLVKKDSEILTGGADKYVPVCGQHLEKK